jgi:hypothetical protein
LHRIDRKAGEPVQKGSRTLQRLENRNSSVVARYHVTEMEE